MGEGGELGIGVKSGMGDGGVEGLSRLRLIGRDSYIVAPCATLRYGDRQQSGGRLTDRPTHRKSRERERDSSIVERS